MLVTLSLGAADVDWLITAPTARAEVTNACWPEYATAASGTPCGIELANGLVSRRFVTTPAFGTIDWLLNATIERGGLRSMMRAPAPEAILRLGGVDFTVGGLQSTSAFRAYINRTEYQDTLTGPHGADVNTTFAYLTHRVGTPQAPFPWTPGTRGSPPDLSRPPKGVTLEVDLVAPANPALTLTVHYELFDSVPILVKWLELRSSSSPAARDVVVEKATVELFAASAPFGAYETHGSSAPGADFAGASAAGTAAPRPLLHAKTDQASCLPPPLRLPASTVCRPCPAPETSAPAPAPPPPRPSASPPPGPRRRLHVARRLQEQRAARARLPGVQGSRRDGAAAQLLLRSRARGARERGGELRLVPRAHAGDGLDRAGAADARAPPAHQAARAARHREPDLVGRSVAHTS